MKLGLNLGYWGEPGNPDLLTLAQEADRLGYSVVWAAEAYGSDAPSVLSWIAAGTRKVDVGSAVMQIPGRSPACTAMTAATLDSLSGGRFRLGLGVSGPQVSEGWHGVRFDKPLGRTREYVEIVRGALSRERLTYSGEHWTLPLPGGPGKALKLTVDPVRERIPIYLAAIGPKNLQLAGEIADGWLALFFCPERSEEFLSEVATGRAAAGQAMTGYDVVANVPVALGSDLEACAASIRPFCALYIGGMGSREQNFYHRLASQLGFGQAADAVQEAYLAGRYAEAAAAVPLEFVAATALIGTADRVADRMAEYSAAGVTTLSVMLVGDDVHQQIATLRTIVEALNASGQGE